MTAEQINNLIAAYTKALAEEIQKLTERVEALEKKLP